jgi:hypothetical protein
MPYPQVTALPVHWQTKIDACADFYNTMLKNKTVINEFDAFKALLAQGIDIDIGQYPNSTRFCH